MKKYKYLDETNGYVYFRLNGKRTELPGKKGSPEFDAAYDKLFAQAQQTKAARKEQNRQLVVQRERNAKGSVASVEWFIQKFFLSEFFVGQQCAPWYALVRAAWSGSKASPKPYRHARLVVSCHPTPLTPPSSLAALSGPCPPGTPAPRNVS